MAVRNMSRIMWRAVKGDIKPVRARMFGCIGFVERAARV